MGTSMPRHFAAWLAVAVMLVGGLTFAPEARALDRCEELLLGNVLEELRPLDACSPCLNALDDETEKAYCGEECPAPLTEACKQAPNPCTKLARIAGVVDRVLPGEVTVTCEETPKVCHKDSPPPSTYALCELMTQVICSRIADPCHILPVCDPAPAYICNVLVVMLSPVYVCYPPTPDLLCPDQPTPPPPPPG